MKLSTADKVFANWIKERDKYTCQRCHKQYAKGDGGLHNSHYFGRIRYTTRFQPENCVALCFYCHKYFDETNKKAYYEFKVKQLGLKKLNALERLANKTIKDVGYMDKKQLEDSIIEIYT
jgi:5-methylcytosine-specific restriction endonuclease McrA